MEMFARSYLLFTFIPMVTWLDICIFRVSYHTYNYIEISICDVMFSSYLLIAEHYIGTKVIHTHICVIRKVMGL